MDLAKWHLSPVTYRNPAVQQMKPTYIQTTNHCIIPFGVEKGVLCRTDIPVCLPASRLLFVLHWTALLFELQLPVNYLNNLSTAGAPSMGEDRRCVGSIGAGGNPYDYHS